VFCWFVWTLVSVVKGPHPERCFKLNRIIITVTKEICGTIFVFCLLIFISHPQVVYTSCFCRFNVWVFCNRINSTLNCLGLKSFLNWFFSQKSAKVRKRKVDSELEPPSKDQCGSWNSSSPEQLKKYYEIGSVLIFITCLYRSCCVFSLFCTRTVFTSTGLKHLCSPWSVNLV